MPVLESEKKIIINREELFVDLYKKAFPGVAKYISENGGSFEEAKDIFQDALVVYYEKIKVNRICIRTTEKAYLMGIAKYLWIKKFNSDKETGSIEEEENLADQQYITTSSGKLLELLNTAGAKCIELLRAFYYDKLDIAAIAGKFGYSGTRSATVQKFKCIEKLRDKVKEKALGYEDFFE